MNGESFTPSDANYSNEDGSESHETSPGAPGDQPSGGSTSPDSNYLEADGTATHETSIDPGGPESSVPSTSEGSIEGSCSHTVHEQDNDGDDDDFESGLAPGWLE